MAHSRKDCIDEIAARSGKSRGEAEDLLEAILDRADGFEGDGMGRDEAYDRARDEFLQEVADQYARERRGAILDMRKESSRHRYYEATREAIRTLSPKKAATAFRLALEAKLVGVNLPFLGNRRSVDAQYVALRRQLLGGFSADLDRAGLLKKTGRRQSAVSRQPPLGRRAVCRTAPAAARGLFGRPRSRRPSEGVRLEASRGAMDRRTV